MCKTLTLSATLLLMACANKTPIVTIPPAACADLVPSGWAEGVEAAPVPDNAPVTLGQALTAPMMAAIVAPWATAYVAMSAALEKANGRTTDAVGIVKRCEAMVNAARPH